MDKENSDYIHNLPIHNLYTHYHWYNRIFCICCICGDGTLMLDADL